VESFATLALIARGNNCDEKRVAERVLFGDTLVARRLALEGEARSHFPAKDAQVGINPSQIFTVERLNEFIDELARNVPPPLLSSICSARADLWNPGLMMGTS
jgi:hypothetical protein